MSGAAMHLMPCRGTGPLGTLAATGVFRVSEQRGIGHVPLHRAAGS